MLDPGYTFDAVKNTMIVEAWPLASRTRRMRLDRIILKSNPPQRQQNEDNKRKHNETHLWEPRSMRLFGHQPVASPIEDEDEDEDEERRALQFERERPRGIKAVLWWTAGWLTYGPRLLKTLVAASFDLFGINAFRTVDDYLWPSDHFGLVAVLTTSDGR